MKIQCLVFLSLSFLTWNTLGKNWIIEKRFLYDLKYSSIERDDIREYEIYFEEAVSIVQDFFDSTFNKRFDIIVHPSRHSLDSTWQQDWKLPTLKSECWMVASGTAFKFDLLSPHKWRDEACEHDFSDKKKTSQLITHELFHVFHGQFNPSPNFSNIEGLDWFIEGLATYASGQCDSIRLSQIRRNITHNNTPKDLDHLWSGNFKYGLSGSMVMFIDKKYGRKMLKQLLTLTKKSELLAKLDINEKTLLFEWGKFIQRQ